VRYSVLVAIAILPALAFGQAVLDEFDAPGANITGLAWYDGYLWAVDQVSDYVYQVDPTTGDVVSSFMCTPPSGFYPTGLAYGQNLVYVGMWNSGTSGYVYKYTPGGSFSGSVNMCGG
jgi:hypothetical protein